jgi:hypothetical protein
MISVFSGIAIPEVVQVIDELHAVNGSGEW